MTPTSTSLYTIAPPSLTSIPNPTTGNFRVVSNSGSTISQIGGNGHNNYFVPKIYIKKKKNNTNNESDLMSLYSSTVSYDTLINQPSMMYETENQPSVSYDNTGYNLVGSYPSNIDRTIQNALLSNAVEQQQQMQRLEQGQTMVDNFGSVNNTSDYSTARDTLDSANKGGHLDKDGNFVHPSNMKKFRQGYQIQPPVCWDIPQKRPPVCLSDKKSLPAAVFANGLSLNSLELNTTVGSIMPGFSYNERSRA
jgi:hypothetical protein